MIVKLLAVPEHPFALGVTVIVAVIGVVPALTPAKDDMLPVPLAANPMDGVLFTQPNVLPVTPPLKDTADTVAPLHTV